MEIVGEPVQIGAGQVGSGRDQEIGQVTLKEKIARSIRTPIEQGRVPFPGHSANP